MKVVLKKPFHVVRAGRQQVVCDVTGRPIGVRLENEVIYLDFDRGPLALTPEEFLVQIDAGTVEEVRSVFFQE